MTDSSNFEKLENRQRWFVNIGITILILLVGAWVRAEIRTNINKDDIEEIRKDYMPYDGFVYALESNQKLINIITSIQDKDDNRYHKALEEWNDLQQIVIKNGSKKTRNVKEIK